MRRLMFRRVGCELRKAFQHGSLDTPGDHHHDVLKVAAKSDREWGTANPRPSSSNLLEGIAKGFVRAALGTMCATDERQKIILGRVGDPGCKR